MNWFKLKYLRWKNTSKQRNKKIWSKTTVESVFYTIQPTNTYPGWLHNNLKLYRVIRHNPENKIIKRMFMEGHLNLFAMKRRWKFAKAIVKSVSLKLKDSKLRRIVSKVVSDLDKATEEVECLDNLNVKQIEIEKKEVNYFS